MDRRARCCCPRPGRLRAEGERPAPPVTLEQWQALPVDKKYLAEWLERLRHGDPKHKDEAEWESFCARW